MPNYSTIVQSPAIRAIVQSGLLVRKFMDALFPPLLWRGEAIPGDFPVHVGDQLIFTGKGLLPRNAQPIAPGVDPLPQTYPVEQWFAQIQKYAGTIDTDMPTDIASAVKLFTENATTLGLQAGLSLNTGARDQAYNAAMSGWTVTATGATGTGVTQIPVQNLNGFTTARNPNLAAGSQVAFNPVSASNPLTVTIYSGASAQVTKVVGYTSTVPGDTTGPGILTVADATTFTSRCYVYSSDATYVVRANGGNSIDALSSGDVLTPALIRSAIARLRTSNVPTYSGSGFYHCHLDPSSELQLFSSDEFQRLNTSIPDYVLYREATLGTMQGVVFFRDPEAPQPQTVLGAAPYGTQFASAPGYTPADPFGGEVYTTGLYTGLVVHRPVIMGQGGLLEHQQDQEELISMAGITGKIGEFDVSNNGIEVNASGVKLILRAPLDRLQDKPSASWKWLGTWSYRTDATTGDAARYKRAVVIETSE